MKQKTADGKQKTGMLPGKSERISGFVFLSAGAFLLCYCLHHQENDAVRYPWGTSPYLFPLALASLLIFLSVILLVRSSRQKEQEAKR